MTDPDDHGRVSTRPVTGLSLRTDRFRRGLVKASGGHLSDGDPGLSPARAPRDPELTNRWAVYALIAGVVALFANVVFVPSVITVVFSVLALRRSRELEARGKTRYGRRRALWALGFAAYGVANITFQLLRAHFWPVS